MEVKGYGGALSVVLKRRELSAAARLKIKEHKMNVIDDPQSNVEDIENMLAFVGDQNELLSTRKYALESLCDVFIDIIPGYKISSKDHSEENQVMFSKETKEIRGFEQKLLSLYSKYIRILKWLLKDNCRTLLSYKKGPMDVHSSGYYMLKAVLDVFCRLLLHASHFDYCEDVFEAVISSCNKLSLCNEALCFNCYEALKAHFLNDQSGETSLEIVRLICRYSKLSINFNSKLIDVLIHLPLCEESVGQVGKQDRNDVVSHKHQEAMTTTRFSKSKKLKKVAKHKVKKLMKKVEPEVSVGKVRANHRAILTTIFTIYFRFLRSAECTVSVLISCLNGVAKFSHLISVEFLEDLFSLMLSFLQDEDLSVKARVMALFSLLKIPNHQESDCYNIDYALLYVISYRTLFDLVIDCSDIICYQNLFVCLNVLLIQRSKEVGIRRCMAFCKRLCNLSLHLSPMMVDMVGNIVKTLCTKTPYLLSKLMDQDSCLGPSYDPHIDHPEYCCPDSALLWELPLMQRYYSQKIRALVEEILPHDKRRKSVGTNKKWSRNIKHKISHSKVPKRLFHVFLNDKVSRDDNKIFINFKVT